MEGEKALASTSTAADAIDRRDLLAFLLAGAGCLLLFALLLIDLGGVRGLGLSAYYAIGSLLLSIRRLIRWAVVTALGLVPAILTLLSYVASDLPAGTVRDPAFLLLQLVVPWGLWIALGCALRAALEKSA